MIDCEGAIILSHSELHSQNLMAHKFLLSLSGPTVHAIEFHSSIILIILNVFNIETLCIYVLVRVTVAKNFPALPDCTVSRPAVHISNVHLCETVTYHITAIQSAWRVGMNKQPFVVLYTNAVVM
jgi:hypothetical protein